MKTQEGNYPNQDGEHSVFRNPYSVFRIPHSNQYIINFRPAMPNAVSNW